MPDSVCCYSNASDINTNNYNKSNSFISDIYKNLDLYKNNGFKLIYLNAQSLINKLIN